VALTVCVSRVNFTPTQLTSCCSSQQPSEPAAAAAATAAHRCLPAAFLLGLWSCGVCMLAWWKVVPVCLCLKPPRKGFVLDCSAETSSVTCRSLQGRPWPQSTSTSRACKDDKQHARAFQESGGQLPVQTDGLHMLTCKALQPASVSTFCPKAGLLSRLSAQGNYW